MTLTDSTFFEFFSLAASTTMALATWISAAISDTYAASPIFAIAMGLIVSVPLIATVGLLVPRRRRKGRRIASRPQNPPVGGDEEGAGRKAQPYLPVLRMGAVFADPSRGPVRLGSDPSSHIRLDGPGIEPLHALVTVDATHGLQIVRLASAEGVGVYVNGKTTPRQSLSGSETIKIGHNILVFNAHDANEPQTYQREVAAAANPCGSAVSAARLAADASNKRAKWRKDETAGAANVPVDHSSVH